MPEKYAAMQAVFADWKAEVVEQADPFLGCDRCDATGSGQCGNIQFLAVLPRIN